MKKARFKVATVAMVARPRASHVHVLASKVSCRSGEIGMHVSIAIIYLYLRSSFRLRGRRIIVTFPNWFRDWFGLVWLRFENPKMV